MKIRHWGKEQFYKKAALKFRIMNVWMSVVVVCETKYVLKRLFGEPLYHISDSFCRSFPSFVLHQLDLAVELSKKPFMFTKMLCQLLLKVKKKTAAP